MASFVILSSAYAGNTATLTPGTTLFADANGVLTSSIGVTPGISGAPGPMQVVTAGSIGQPQYYASSDGLRAATMSFVDVDPVYRSNVGIAFNFRLESVPLGSIVVTAGGAGYPANATNGAVTLSGGNAITSATAHYVSNGSGVITSVVLDTPGLYRSAPNSIVFGGGGTGATAYVAMASIGKTPIDIRNYNIPDTGGDNSGALFVSTGGNGSFTTYQIQNLRPDSTRAWRQTLQGAIETGTDSGSQAIIVFPGMGFTAKERATITADVSAIGTPASIVLNAPANTTGAWPVPGAYEYTAPGGGVVNYPATCFLTLTDPVTLNSETFGYTAVTNGGVASGALTFTIASRNLGGAGNKAFVAANGTYAEPTMRSTGVYTRIGNNVSDAFLVQPGNLVYDTTRWGFVIGSKAVNGAPTGVTWGVRLSGRMEFSATGDIGTDGASLGVGVNPPRDGYFSRYLRVMSAVAVNGANLDGSLALSANGTVFGLNYGCAQSVTSPDPTGANLTIAVTLTGEARVTPTANRTGVILAAGVRTGQCIAVANESASFSVTFDVAATSNVSNGVSCVIGPLTAKMFIWNTVAARWFPHA